MLHGTSHFFDMVDDGYVVEDKFIFGGARTGYDLKVGRRVYLRFGLGAGLGYHRIDNISSSCEGMDPGMCGGDTPHYPANRVLPHFLVDLHWVFRVGRNFEMMFAPLFLSPSQLIFSPWNDKYYRGGYYSFSVVPIRLCARF